MADETSVNPSDNNSKTPLMIVAAVIAVAAIGFFVYSSMNKSSDTSMQPSPTQAVTEVSPTTTGEQTNPPDSTTSAYKNGTYTAVGNYTSPGGAETVKVTVTLEDGKIVDSVFEPQATRPMSVKFQGIFGENYKVLVVGKNADEVKLDKVSGSSLTPKGFNDAIEKIKAEAHV